MKTRGVNMSFFIDKEFATGYGPLTESLFTFCMQLFALPRENSSVLREGSSDAVRTVYVF